MSHLEALIIFDVEKKELRIKELQSKTEAPDFWNDQMGAQKILQEIKTLHSWVDLWNKVNKKPVNPVFWFRVKCIITQFK